MTATSPLSGCPDPDRVAATVRRAHAPIAPKRSIAARLSITKAWLAACTDGSATFPVTRLGRPDYRAISRATTGEAGHHLLIAGHPIRDLIDAHWVSIRHRLNTETADRSSIWFGPAVSTDGSAAVNASADTYAITGFEIAKLRSAMPAIVEGMLAACTVKWRTTGASAAWWCAFDAWQAVADEAGFELWLRNLMATPTGGSKRARLSCPYELLGLLRRHGLLLLPLGLITGTVPQPCSSWVAATVLWRPSALTDWERSALLSDDNAYDVLSLLLSVGPMDAPSEFPRGAFVDAIADALSRDGTTFAERLKLTNRALEVAQGLDHHVALGSIEADGPPPLGTGDAGSHRSLVAALDKHLRENGLRGKTTECSDRLTSAADGPAGEWASLFLRYVNAQHWKSSRGPFALASLIVESMARMAEVPRLADPDLRERLVGRPPSFFERWGELTGSTDYMCRDGMLFVRNALRWHARSTASFCNPLRPTDIPQGPSLTKSTKVLLPRDIIEEAKVVCRELMDLAWAGAEGIPPTLSGGRWRELLMVKVPVPGRGLVSRVCPVLPTLLYSLLTMPIRGMQARLTDSGEADEVVAVLKDGDGPASGRIDWIRNEHPLARPKRRQGIVRSIDDTATSTRLIGLWINTNKSRAQGGSGADRGYEIPWQHDPLIEALLRLRDWQSAYNPVHRLLSRADLSEGSMRPTEALKGRMPAYAYLFRHPRDTAPSRRLEPARETHLVRVFLAVLEEIERRRKGTPGEVKLILKRERGVPTTALYTVHGLRVTGITAFVEAGVPVPIIAEFLAGHLNVLVTIYYTKFGPAKVTDILEQALAASHRDGRDDTIGGVPWDVLRGRLIGNPGSSAAGLSGANTAHCTIGTDGLCPNGQSRCHEGGRSAASDGPVPTPGGARNCPLCRFWVSGEPFLAGQVVAMNALLYHIKEKGEALVASYAQMRALPTDSSRRHAVANAVDTTERDMDIMVRTLQARYGMVLRSLEHASAREAAGTGDVRPAIIGNSEDAFVGLTEVSELRFLDTVSKAYELLPGLSTPSAPIRRGVLLDRLFDAAGIDAGLFRLPAAVAARAGGLLTDMLIGMTGDEAGLDDLAAGRTTLASLGLDRVRQGLSSALAPMLAASLPAPKAIGGSDGGPS